MADEIWFQQLADMTRFANEDRAPAHLKSKVYSSIVTNLAQSGPLLDLREVKDAGGVRPCAREPSASLEKRPIDRPVPRYGRIELSSRRK